MTVWGLSRPAAYWSHSIFCVVRIGLNLENSMWCEVPSWCAYTVCSDWSQRSSWQHYGARCGLFQSVNSMWSWLHEHFDSRFFHELSAPGTNSRASAALFWWCNGINIQTRCTHTEKFSNRLSILTNVLLNKRPHCTFKFTSTVEDVMNCECGLSADWSLTWFSFPLWSVISDVCF